MLGKAHGAFPFCLLMFPPSLPYDLCQPSKSAGGCYHVFTTTDPSCEDNGQTAAAQRGGGGGVEKSMGLLCLVIHTEN
jgi:hypothetical protein